jgi:hypothetical protein
MQAPKMLMVVAAAAMSLGGVQAASADSVFWKIGTRIPVGDSTVTIRVGGWEHDHHRGHRCSPRCGHFQRGHRCDTRCDHWDRRDRHRRPGWDDHRCDRDCRHWDRGRGDRRWQDRRGGRWKDDCDDRRGRDRRRSRGRGRR